MDAEILLASTYAGFLVLVAAILEGTAHYVHRKAQKSSTQGFIFIPEHDLWRCPTGQHLHRQSADETFRTVRYRAQPHHCNSCNQKPGCTDSDSGRVLEHQKESWLESGIRTFHRGMSLALVLLATTILSIEIERHQQRAEQAILSAFVLCLAIAGLRLVKSLRSSSSS